MKHKEEFQRFLAEIGPADALRNLPSADPVSPGRLIRIAGLCQPVNLRHEAPYYEWRLITDLVNALMEEWGWTKEEREK